LRLRLEGEISKEFYWDLNEIQKIDFWLLERSKNSKLYFPLRESRRSVENLFRLFLKEAIFCKRVKNFHQVGKIKEKILIWGRGH